MFARRFFYVSAGLFCLALAYQLGAATAHGQSASLECAGVDGQSWAVLGRRLYSLDLGAPPSSRPVIPGTSAVIACGTDRVVLENADVYQWNGSIWVLVGNFLGGPTPAQTESWGAMKSRYRGERGAAQPTQDR